MQLKMILAKTFSNMRIRQRPQATYLVLSLSSTIAGYLSLQQPLQMPNLYTLPIIIFSFGSQIKPIERRFSHQDYCKLNTPLMTGYLALLSIRKQVRDCTGVAQPFSHIKSINIDFNLVSSM